MMSRTAYKGLRIDWYPDECAAPLPKPTVRAHASTDPIAAKPMPIKNPYTVLDIDGVDSESDEDNSSYLTSGIRVNNWADAAVA